MNTIDLTLTSFPPPHNTQHSISPQFILTLAQLQSNLPHVCHQQHQDALRTPESFSVAVSKQVVTSLIFRGIFYGATRLADVRAQWGLLIGDAALNIAGLCVTEACRVRLVRMPLSWFREAKLCLNVTRPLVYDSTSPHGVDNATHKTHTQIHKQFSLSITVLSVLAPVLLYAPLFHVSLAKLRVDYLLALHTKSHTHTNKQQAMKKDL